MNTKEMAYQVILNRHQLTGGMCGISFVGIIAELQLSDDDIPDLKQGIRELMRDEKILKREGINKYLYFIKKS